MAPAEGIAEILFDYRSRGKHNAFVPERSAGGAKADSEVYGAAVDETFLTEMSNLSPPIIYPPPSALTRPAGKPAGRSLWRGLRAP